MAADLDNFGQVLCRLRQLAQPLAVDASNVADNLPTREGVTYDEAHGLQCMAAGAAADFEKLADELKRVSRMAWSLTSESDEAAMLAARKREDDE